MNRRQVLQASAMSLLTARLGNLPAATAQIEQDAVDQYRYGHALTGSEMFRVEETEGAVGAASGDTHLPDPSSFIIPFFFEPANGKFIHCKDFAADLDSQVNYRMNVNVKAIHLNNIPKNVKENTLQVRTVASAGKEEQEDWLSWLLFTGMECAFKKSDSSKDSQSGLVGLGAATGPDLKKTEQPVVKSGQIQVSFELFGQERKSWLFKVLKAVSSVTAAPILAQVAFPQLLGAARNFILQTVQRAEKEGTTRILASPQGTYGVAKGTTERYRLGTGLWALVTLQDLRKNEFLINHTIDFDEMQFAIKKRDGSVLAANYMVVQLDFNKA